AEDESVHTHEDEEGDLDPERGASVELQGFRPGQQQTACHHYYKANPLPRPELLHNIRHRPALHRPAKQTQIRCQHHAAKKSDPQKMKSTQNRIGKSPLPDRRAQIRAFHPLKHRNNSHSARSKPLRRTRSFVRPPQLRSTTTATG